MNNGLHASPADIVNDGVAVVSKAEELDAELNSFDASINGLNGVWRGDAATSLTNAYNEFKPILKKFQQLLDSKGQAVQKAGSGLGDTEAENARLASNL